MKNVEYGPDCISIITTYKCTAECRECCFECGPYQQARISNKQIRKAIDEAVDMGTVKFIVWTGGECTLLGKDLIEGIRYANSKGLPSRIVSNGWWARNRKLAKQKLIPLIEAGLVELNISTGDNHQEFVKADTAIRAAVVGAELELSSVISVEKTSNSKFTPETLIKSSVYRNFIDSEKNTENLKIINPVWVSFHDDTKYGYSKSELNNPDLEKGCSNLFTFIGVNPFGKIIGCCGLTMRYIGAMNLGSLDTKTLSEAYMYQYDDLIKKWIFVDGPLKIIEQVKKWDSQVKIPKFPHNCLYCAYMYNNSKIRDLILRNYKEVEDEINTKFNSKIQWYKVKSEHSIIETR